jgi:predicted metal-dependent hydrolase
MELSASAVRIIRSKRSTIAIHIDRGGELTVRAPQGASESVIRSFLERKRPWIEEKLRIVRARALSLSRRGGRYPYLGEWHPVTLIDETENRPPLLLHDGRFLLHRSRVNDLHGLIEQWYRAQARRILPDRVAHYATPGGPSIGKINITGAKKRWGSCSSSGSLNFSWRLVMAPLHIIDYVVVHELAHRFEPNHSAKFWARVSELMPEYRERRAWLKKEGYLLSI